MKAHCGYRGVGRLHPIALSTSWFPPASQGVLQDQQPSRIRGRGLGGVDPFDVRLEDDELLDEVELTANLIVAANQSEAHMSVTQIDEILGVIPQPRSGD